MKISLIRNLRMKSVLMILFLSSLLAGCSSEEENLSKEIIRPAKMIEIIQQDSNSFLNYPAIIQSLQLRDLTFEVGGILDELSVIESQNKSCGVK